MSPRHPGIFGSCRLAWTILAAAMLATVPAAADPMAELEALGRALKSADGWQSGYQQTYVAPGMTLGDEASGEVWVAWPSRALFVTGDPVQRLMGLDGRQVRLVDFETDSCDDHRLNDDEWARLPLAAILDPAAAVGSFTVLASEQGRGFVLVPHAEGGLDRVEVRLGDDDLPSEVLVRDVQGSLNRLLLGPWARQDGAPELGWTPDPPEGVACTSDLSLERRVD